MHDPDTMTAVASSEDIVVVSDRYYILATSALADQRTLVVKQGDTFAVLDRTGDLRGGVGSGQQGLYHADTRFLSRLELRLANARPLLLSSSVTQDNALVAVDLTNADILENGHVTVPRDTVHLFRGAFLWDGACHVTLRLHSFAEQLITLPLRLSFDADFADIFEVRGSRRQRRGVMLPARVSPGLVVLRYQGLDDLLRTTTISFDLAPDQLSADDATWNLRLAAGAETTVRIAIQYDEGLRPSRPTSCELARAEARSAAVDARGCWAELDTDNEQFDALLSRSQADLRMMVTETPSGPYPYAGVPWYSTVFGRDGLITALETLWINPGLAAGVLRFLAAHQATDHDPARDAAPGKILHELRAGEMAALREVPFGRYYGSADATPLFVMLAGAYHEHTGDTGLIEALWPSLDAALRWVTGSGDVDGDGFVEYARQDADGLVNQGWKDSVDAVSHADGLLARGPIAICEVQGYVHAAFRAGAGLARALGRHDAADQLTERAEVLRERIEAAFWCDELGTYVLALDGDKQRCRVRTSNAGHLLYTGTASPARAEAVADALLREDSYSGWGVRTLSARERRYNPLSYHNGSVWPHDNAMIAAGMARYGMKAQAEQILSGLFDAAQVVDLHRLPELFCGLGRRSSEGPTLYPVACAPQAWAAGAVFLLLQSCLGLTLDGARRRVVLNRPRMPAMLERLRIRGLRVGTSTVDLELRSAGRDVSTRILRRDGEVELTIVE